MERVKRQLAMPGRDETQEAGMTKYITRTPLLGVVMEGMTSGLL